MKIEAVVKTSGEDAPSFTMIRSSQQDLEEEETAFKMTPVLEDLQLPQTNERLSETLT